MTLKTPPWLFRATTCLVLGGFSALAQDTTAPATTPPAVTAPAPEPVAPAPTPAPAPTEAPAAAERPATYTIVKGDSLWTIAHKFHTSVKELKALNNITKTKGLQIGQVIKLPPATSAAPAAPEVPTAPAAPATPAPVAPVAPAAPKSTQAKPVKTPALADKATSSPEVASVTTSTSEDVATEAAPKALPLKTSSAMTVSDIPRNAYYHSEPPQVQPADLPPDSNVKITSQTTTVVKGPSDSSKTPHKGTTIYTTTRITKVTSPANSQISSSKTRTDIFHDRDSSDSDWGQRFRAEAIKLSDQDIDYCESWRPPGESSSWVMDCSNTARYLYKVTANITLPRTASDQYYFLHQQGQAWDVPTDSNGTPSVAYLRENLQPGDLLFWKNTYRPERQPPITHVMIFLGTNTSGQWIMAGSQTTYGGSHNRRHGGPDIYLFNPTQPSGGYSTWMGMVRHKGQFCAFGRPLKADPARLVMASNQ